MPKISCREELPKRQRQLLELIGRAAQNGRTPVVAELIHELGLARESSLTSLLLPLQRKGLVHVEGGVRGRQRIISLADRGRALLHVGLPVLGSIPAGPLREALQDAREWVDEPGVLLAHQLGDFLLRVDGDSMIGDGILPGDYVLLRPGVAAHNGEIAAVQAHDESRGEYFSTLKHIHFDEKNKEVRLKASNPHYDDMIFPADKVDVAGVFRGLLRLPNAGGKRL